jgi:hypothetical protein
LYVDLEEEEEVVVVVVVVTMTVEINGVIVMNKQLLNDI